MAIMREEVLDQGFVELLDVMGSDSTIADDARVSVTDESVKKRSNAENLIRYMMSEGHTSPFEHQKMKFRVKCPIFVWRQWIRHRTANVNEMSGRYSVMPEEFWHPDTADITMQSSDNHQGRTDEEAAIANHAIVKGVQLAGDVFTQYRAEIKAGVSREVARRNLPLSTYTVAVWTMDLHNLFHFLNLRLSQHAQKEIRDYASAISRMVAAHFPVAWNAFADFKLNSLTLSLPEQIALAMEWAGREVTEDDFQTKGEYKRWMKKRGKIMILKDIMEITKCGPLDSKSSKSDTPNT